MPFRDINTPSAWEKHGTPSTIRRISSNTGLKYLNNEVRTGINDFPYGYPFDQKRNYQFITKVTNHTGTINTFNIDMDPDNTLFNSGLISTTRTLVTSSNVTFYAYAVPNSNGLFKVLNRYSANENFQCGIANAKMNDIDFIINGYREFSYDSSSFNDIIQPSGWVFVGNNTDITSADTGASFSFGYEWMSNPGAISPSYSTFEVPNPNSSNYLAKLIDYDKFNLKFDYLTNDENYGIDIYLVRSNKLNNKSQWVKIASVTQSTTQSFYKTGLDGLNNGLRNYLVITASQSTASQFICSLTDIYIYGGYNPQNNRQFLTTNEDEFSENTNIVVDIPYSSHIFDVSNNGVTVSLTSKIGNGTFKSGIWENGVWNNGWRDDKQVSDFENVEYSILTNSDVSWKIKIIGPPESISEVIGSVVINKFKAGDKVTIGNIVAIDINDNRKLLKGQYTVEEVGIEQSINGAQQGFITVNLDTTFPYRRIERDSPNHKIKITRNIWLSGAFFNGYFSGVWNNGLFKGYPLITEMFDTHWIDGFFNGGHFESNYPDFKFTVISARTSCSVGYTNLTLEDNHGIKQGDYVFVEFSNIDEFVNAGGVNNYDGLVRVLAVDGNKVTINRLFSSERGLQDNDGLGTVKRYTSTGLIQNFKFYDNNISQVKSSESNISSTVFSYNSWIDVNYDNSRSVTLGRDFRAYESLTGKSINRNNLFGYPTYDVLSSASRFRDSNSLDVKLYKLGTKYKVFTDFIGEFSEFNEPFNPDVDFSNFFLGGWTYSYVTSSNIKFNRTESIISVNDSNAQSYIDSGVTGDELFVTASNSGAIVNNSNIDISKARYSVVEFDVITHSVASYEYTFENLDVFSSTSLSVNSPFTFNNLNSDSASLSNGIIALNSNMSVSGNYDFGMGFDYTSIASLRAVNILSDGSLIICGYQNSYNGITQTSNWISKINEDGTLDTTFDLNFSNILTGLPIKILVDNSDNIYIINSYTSDNRKILKVSPNGIVDPTFIIRSSGTIDDAVLDSSGLLFVGSFATFSYGVSNTTISRNKIARITTSGSNDPTFNPGTGFSVSSERPRCVSIDNLGNIYVGGNFRRYNSTVNNCNTIIKLSPTGTNLSVFSSTDGFFPYGSALNTTVTRILYDNGYLFVVGNFTSYVKGSSTSLVNRIIKIDANNGDVDTSFNYGSGFNLEASDIKFLESDKLVVTTRIRNTISGPSNPTYKGLPINNGIVVLNRTNGDKLASCLSDFNTNTVGSYMVQDFVVVSSDVICVGNMASYTGSLKEITSTYNVLSSIDGGGEITNIEVTVDITQTDVSKLTINLKSPSGDVINIKNSGNGSGNILYNTTFSTLDTYPSIILSSTPYTGTFKMDKVVNVGNAIISNVSVLSDSDILGEWTLYIKDENSLSNTTLNGWTIKFSYDLFDTEFINNEPLAKFPLINFSNLNYEISTQRSGNEIVQVYKRMSYLPVNNNINHLLTTNTFRLDSNERATPEQWGGFGTNLQTKKYEYFYNKTDLMMSINGNGFLGGSQSTIVMDNIKFYEVDMIPFFKYFNDSNIYKGVQIPYNGLAPEIDYLDSDFVFVDNVSVGLDVIDTEIVTEIVCNDQTVDVNDFSILLEDITLSGSPSGTQPITIEAILENLINSSVVLDGYDITWTLNGDIQLNNSGNSGNSPFVNIVVENSTTYLLELTVIYAGITRSESCNITVSNVVTTTAPTAILNLISIIDLGSSNFEVSFSGNFPLFQVFSQVRINDSFSWSNPVLFSTSVSPQQRVVSVGGGSFQMRIYSIYNGQIIYSNILTHT